MTSELEEKFQELSSTKTVRGVLILNAEGAPVKSSLDAKTTESYSAMMHEIVATARRLFQVSLMSFLVNSSPCLKDFHLGNHEASIFCLVHF